MRVCDTCHFKITNKQEGSNRNLLADNNVKFDNSLDEDEEALQKAIAASLEKSDSSRPATSLNELKKQRVSFSPEVGYSNDDGTFLILFH